MFFGAKCIFVVCQAVSVAVLLLAAKIQDGCLKLKSIIFTRVASSNYHYDDRKTLLKPTIQPLYINYFIDIITVLLIKQ